jgi:PAS domain S-box-containing protein/diguanylate cyclase (GGDEF)-like protein
MNTEKHRWEGRDFWSDTEELWAELRSGVALQLLRGYICDWMLGISAWMSLLLLALSLGRLPALGWQPMFGFQIGIVATFWGVYAVRRRLPLQVTAGIQIAAYLAVGWLGYWSLGLYSGGTSWLALAGLVAALLLGIRAGVFVWLLALVGTAVLAGLNLAFQRHPLVFTDGYLFSVYAWTVSAAAWALPAFLVLWAGGLFGREGGTLIDRAAELSQQLRNSEKRFRMVIDSAPNVGIVTTDDTGRVVEWSDGAEKMFGRPEAEMMGQTLERIMPAGLRKAHRDGLSAAKRQGALRSSNAMHQVLGLRANGDEFSLELSLGSWMDGGRQHFIAVMMDTTERSAVRKNIELLNFAFEQSPLGIAILDRKGLILYCNGHYQAARGLSDADIRANNALDLEDNLLSDIVIKEVMDAAQRESVWRKEIMLHQPNGRPRWEHVNISVVCDEKKEVTNFLLVAEDVTQSKSDQDEKFHLANYCPLTGLPNRNHLVNKIEEGLRACHNYFVVLVDLVGIKHVNESLGFSAGDALILDAAQRLENLKPFSSGLNHLGGGQFVLSGGNWSIEEVDEFCGKIVSVFQVPFKIKNERIFQLISIGISISPEDGVNPVDLLSHAHTAKGLARNIGENKWAYFSRQLNAEAHERLHLDALLRQALDGSEFVLHYQPKVDRAGGFKGVEALLRWNSSELGMVPPSKFIAHLERSDLILMAGRWVLNEGCRYATLLHAAGYKDAVVAINVSPKQFLHDGFLQTLKNAIESHGISPKMLELEITESIFIGDETGRVNAQANVLRSLGVRLALDDFGTGYASLGYLRNIPFDVVKIDRSFIHELFDRPENSVLLKAIIEMVHALGMEVVAEGVEELRQSEFLIQHDCDVFQGYLFGRPMDSSTLLEWLSRR